MHRVDCSEQIATNCAETMIGSAADPDRPPICQACYRLLCKAMNT